ncbi:hypothetical protein BJ165DRAFT_1534052 [Panaeolus papilionaceus]|nr:hypothetical protein BJ165DRAFT_1534052 [Panaeolus papilionaceus]
MTRGYRRADTGDGQGLQISLDEPVQKPRMARKDSAYFTADELNIIRPWRVGFRDILGRDVDARASYLRQYVFPPLLSYWYNNPDTTGRTAPENIGIWTDRIAEYTARNWKSRHQLYQLPTLRVTMSDYFYNYHYDQLYNEVKKIVQAEEGPEAEVTSIKVMKKRHAAVRNIHDRSTPSEWAKFEDARKLVKERGYTDDLKKRNFAKHGMAQLKQAQHLLQLELGIASVQFYVAEVADGSVNLGLAENIAQTYGFITAQSFQDKHTEEISTFAALISAYVRDLKMITAGGIAAAGHGEEATTKAAAVTSMLTTPTGYPILPEGCADLDRATKENLWKAFTLAHYRLASNDPSCASVPWTQINNNGLSNYVDPQYLPLATYPDFKFTAYRQTNPNQLRQFFIETLKRQQDLGPEKSFRFQAVYNGIHNTIVQARYPEETIQDVMIPAAENNPMFANVMRGKQGKRKRRGKAGEREVQVEVDRDGGADIIPTNEITQTDGEPAILCSPTGERVAADKQGECGGADIQPTEVQVDGATAATLPTPAITPAAMSQDQQDGAQKKPKKKRPKQKRKKRTPVDEAQEDNEHANAEASCRASMPEIPQIDGEAGAAGLHVPAADSSIQPRRATRQTTKSGGPAEKYPTPFSERSPTPAANSEQHLRSSSRLRLRKKNTQ